MVYVLCHGQVSGEDRFPYGRKGCRLGFYGRFGLGLSQTAGLDIIKNEEKPPSEHWYDFDLFPRDWQLPDLALTPSRRTRARQPGSTSATPTGTFTCWRRRPS